MSSLLIRNGILLTLNERNEVVQNGSVYVEDGRITAVGEARALPEQADRVIDAAGSVVMPGLVNVHHHLYSTFARGFTPPGPPARTFREILERLWWKLDAELDGEDVYYSALLALLDAARAGCTTVIDHHASPGCCEGSLDRVEKAFRDVGLNGCLCYEVTDRHTPGQGIEENERFIRKCRASGDDQVSALFGMHALMTLGTETLERCAEIGRSLGAGFHVHVAESEDDVTLTREQHACGVMQRFKDFGLVTKGSIFVHGIHFAGEDMDLLAEAGAMYVNCPESNMNNGLPVAPVPDLLKRGVPAGLGTDGMSSHVLSQARALYMAHRARERDPRIMFGEAGAMVLENNRTIANRVFREKRGRLEPGYQADLAIADYVPFTPLTPETLYGHLLFGLAFARVRTTMARGRLVVDDGTVLGVDEAEIRAKCVERARHLWRRIG
jgi:putative selenium metabolism protein SsnA